MTIRNRFLLIPIFIFPGLSWSNGNDLDYEWQLDRLLSPSAQELTVEKEGQVFIYSGIKDKDIELALDRNHSRIENMMFVNTIQTDEHGDAIVDSATGELLVEDDC